MTGRVLVVDDILANVRLLEARLTAEYFDVLTASSGSEALELLDQERVDVVLLDVMMPAMDGFEVCRRIKRAPKTMHVPVIMVTALDQTADKIQGLEAGADDFLSKPVDDIALVTRVKNLTRLKALNDQMMLRMAACNAAGGLAGATGDWWRSESRGRILVVEDDARTASRVVATLARHHDVHVEPQPQQALLRLDNDPHDLLIVSLNLAGADGLRLCSQIRSIERTRHLPIVVLAHPDDESRLLRGLDMGVNDYLTRPIDRNELIARVRTQIRRKRHSDHLRDHLEQSVELAVTDALTGLNNRRYLDRHLRALAEDAKANARPISVLVADIDNFKSVNDTHGHDAGDNVLREFALRLRRNTRGVDLACRLGGEEFVVVMPDTALELACQVGERVRNCIASQPFQANPDTCISVTASVGVAALEDGDTLDGLLKRADNALYAAKREGRNRVVADAA